jgi:hypothetical protein
VRAFNPLFLIPYSLCFGHRSEATVARPSETTNKLKPPPRQPARRLFPTWLGEGEGLIWIWKTSAPDTSYQRALVLWPRVQSRGKYLFSLSISHAFISHLVPQSTPQIPKKIHLSLAKQILFTIQLPFFQTTECVSIAVSSPTTPPSKEPQIYIIPHSNLQHHHSDSWLHHFLTPIPVLDHPPLSQHHRNYNYNPHHHTQRRHR